MHMIKTGINTNCYEQDQFFLNVIEQHMLITHQWFLCINTMSTLVCEDSKVCHLGISQFFTGTGGSSGHIWACQPPVSNEKEM